MIFSVSDIRLVEAVIPSVELFLQTNIDNDIPPTNLLVSQAYYGTVPPEQKIAAGEDNQKALVSPPTNNLFLCQSSDESEIDGNVLESTKDAWIAVPRGGCTYETKTWIAQSIYGAYGIIVYNTLGSRYSFNETTTTDERTDANILWPLEYFDYDCDNARAEIPSNELHFFLNPDEATSADGPGTGPYDFETNDRLLTGDTVDNLCKIHDASDLRNCPSKRCLVAHKDDKTNATTSTATDTTTVCCAWDILLNPYPDTDLDKNVTIKIPTLFATMEQWGVISEAMDTSPTITVLAYSRWRPSYNCSAVIIVLFGAFVASFAAFRSADDYHIGISKLWQSKKKSSAQMNRNQLSGNQQQGSLVSRNNASLREESLELEPIHALLFVVMSSFSLFVLFFFKVRSFTQNIVSTWTS